MASGKAIGCFGLTEPDAGSDAAAMRTTARQVAGGDWIINGTKMWITNGNIADVAVVWARADDGSVRGFVVPTDVSGFTATTVKRKMSLRASNTAELALDDVRLPTEAVLPGVASMRGPLSCLSEARYGIVWGVSGAARTCYETALGYAKDRSAFGGPIARLQLTQQRLVEMMVRVQKANLLALHLGRMKDSGTLSPAQISFGKMDNVREAMWVAREARSLLGANGITLDYAPIRHMMNLESVYTYEGTNEIHQLILGQAITGYNAFGEE
jgi:glutaryl-CoA dehydrogenase